MQQHPSRSGSNTISGTGLGFTLAFWCATAAFIPGAFAAPQPPTSNPAVSNLAVSNPGASNPDASKSVVSDVDVHTFGAKGDGKSIDTDAINRAIADMANKGGGTVIFSAGTYESGSIHLQSNVTLHLDANAKIEAIDPTAPSSYDLPEPNPAAGRYQDDSHAHWHNSLIWGDGLHHIGITGPGEIDGARLAFHGKRQTNLANKTIALKSCDDVILRDFSVLSGGHFAVLASGVDNLQIEGLTVDTNRDGIDLDCCKHLHVARCAVNAPFDDGICLKSSWALGHAVLLEDAIVEDCALTGFDVGTLIDHTHQTKTRFIKDVGPVSRIKLGTESAGGFKNVTIRNCTFSHTRGLAVESVDGGTLEDVTIDHITMDHVADSPIFVRLGSRLHRPAAARAKSTLQNVKLSNIIATQISARFPAIIAGVDGNDVKNITCQNIELDYNGGGKIPPPTTQPLMKDHAYPEPETFGNLAAFGLYAINVDGLHLNNVTIRCDLPDARPAILLEQVENLTTEQTQIQNGSKTKMSAWEKPATPAN